MNIKTFKRNAVLAAVAAFVGTAVYLNWAYGQQQTAGTVEPPAPVLEETAPQEEPGLYYTLAEEEPQETLEPEPEDQEAANLEDYFAKVRLTRARARDEAAAALQTVAGSEAASQETVNEALGQMTKIAAWSMQEAELETMLLAKGFTDCVVFLTEDGVTVTAAIDGGLTNADVAKITDLVLSETTYPAEVLKVVEVK